MKTTLFVTGVEPEITQEDLKGFFYVFGDIKSVIVAHKTKCAFINFTTRASAELAAEKVAEIGLNLKGHSLKVVWARPKPQGGNKEKTTKPIDLNTIQPPAPPSMNGKEKVKYPSQNPSAQGSSA